MTTTHMPMCLVCRHFDGDEGCTAFPSGIPVAIMFEFADHREPFTGDNGVRFESNGSDMAERVLVTYGLEAADHPVT